MRNRRVSSCKRNHRDCPVDAHVKGDGSLQTPGPLSCPPKYPPRGGRHERSVAVNVGRAEQYAADRQRGLMRHYGDFRSRPSGRNLLTAALYASYLPLWKPFRV